MVVSIIIPVYNTELYLRRCLESILLQEYSDFEVLLIDDGSTDESGAICDAYEKKDNRIHVFHKENGGVSSARNLGIEQASGEWVYFVDSDDELLPEGLQTLVACISEEVDIVMGGFLEVNESGVVIDVKERRVLSLTKKQSIISLYNGHGSFYFYCGYLWMRLLRRSVILSFDLRFDTSIAIKEDALFLMQYICRSNGITRQTTSPIYKYCKRSDSAMGKVEHGFDPSYVDSFLSLVKMKHEIDTLYPFYSGPVFIAKQAIYSRYCTIINMMATHQVHDYDLKKDLNMVMRRELGHEILFKVERKIRKLIKMLEN